LKYKVIITHSAEKFLNKLSKRNYNLVVNAIFSLADNPYQAGIKKLEGMQSTYRIRAGNYRILYQIKNAELVVTVVRIGDRKDVY
jgi:mRNA interferase RelE/StbE